MQVMRQGFPRHDLASILPYPRRQVFKNRPKAMNAATTDPACPSKSSLQSNPRLRPGSCKKPGQSGAPDGIVLADACYGEKTSFRETVSELGLQYAAAVTRVGARGTAPVPPGSSVGESDR